MKTAYAVRISKKNLQGLRNYGYATRVTDDNALASYLVMGSGGPYTVTCWYFDEQFKFTDDGAIIDLINLEDFGCSKDERTLRPFVPKKLDMDEWDSFILRLFHDDYANYVASFEREITYSPRVENIRV